MDSGSAKRAKGSPLHPVMSHEPKKFPMEIQEVARERTLSRPRSVNSPSFEDDQVVVNEAEAQAERDDLGARGHLHPGAAFGGAEAREEGGLTDLEDCHLRGQKGYTPNRVKHAPGFQETLHRR